MSPSAHVEVNAGVAKVIARAIGAHDEVGAAASLSVEVAWVYPRPWGDKWRELLRRRDRLQRAYAGSLGEASSDDFKDYIADFADACLEFRDHLGADKSVRDSYKAAGNCIKNGKYLPVVRDVSNIDKRREPDLMHDTRPAYVSGMTSPAIGCSVTHERTIIHTPIDALALANGAVDEWEAFLKSRDLI